MHEIHWAMNFQFHASVCAGLLSEQHFSTNALSRKKRRWRVQMTDFRKWLCLLTLQKWPSSFANYYLPKVSSLSWSWWSHQHQSNVWGHGLPAPAGRARGAKPAWAIHVSIMSAIVRTQASQTKQIQDMRTLALHKANRWSYFPLKQ